MNTTRYWVQLSLDHKLLGAGFFLTSRYVVTAAHCVRAMDMGAHIDVRLEGNSLYVGRLHDRIDEADLALIEVIGANKLLDLPIPDVATTDVAWWSPYRPARDEAHLAGRVIHGQTEFECRGGAVIESVELQTEVLLGDYSGYSGSPIQKTGSKAEPHVLGLLIEQYPDRQDPARSSNVLFAATVDEVFRRFECFDLIHLLDGIRRARKLSPPSQTDSVPPAQVPDQADTKAIERGRLGLQALMQWENEGWLNSFDGRALRVQLARSVVQDMIERRAHATESE